MKHKVSTLEGALLDAAVAKALGRLVLEDEPGWEKGDYAALRREYGGRHVVRWYARSGEDAEGPATDEVGGWESLDSWGSPSTDGRMAYEIIKRKRITVQASRAGDWRAWVGDGDSQPAPEGRAGDPLIAAMRALVASELGEEVEL